MKFGGSGMFCGRNGAGYLLQHPLAAADVRDLPSSNEVTCPQRHNKAVGLQNRIRVAVSARVRLEQSASV